MLGLLMMSSNGKRFIIRHFALLWIENCVDFSISCQNPFYAKLVLYHLQSAPFVGHFSRLVIILRLFRLGLLNG